MNKFFRHPATNAVGLAVFSTFYGVIFLGFYPHLLTGTGETQNSFWLAWDTFLLANGPKYLAVALLILTAVVIAMLLRHHSVYDEYHTAILLRCLAVAVVLALMAIGLFFVLVIIDPVGIVSKLTLMVSINWTTVVLADLVYLIVCRMR